MTLRKGKEEDLTALVRMEEEAFSRPLTKEDFILCLSSPRYCLTVAEEEGIPVGLTVFYDIEPTAELLSVTVLPAFRRRGVGESLLNKTMQTAAERGNSEMLLDVRVSNSPAVALYKKLGFTIIAERKDFYDLPTENGYTMRAGLSEK